MRSDELNFVLNEHSIKLELLDGNALDSLLDVFVSTWKVLRANDHTFDGAYEEYVRLKKKAYIENAERRQKAGEQTLIAAAKRVAGKTEP